MGFWEECLEALEETFLRPRASRSSDNDATMTLLEAEGRFMPFVFTWRTRAMVYFVKNNNGPC